MPIHSTSDRWILETERTDLYTSGLDPEGRLVNFYWGERLTGPEDYPGNGAQLFWSSFNDLGQTAREEYPAETGLKYIEPCFKANYPDGVRDLCCASRRLSRMATTWKSIWLMHSSRCGSCCTTASMRATICWSAGQRSQIPATSRSRSQRVLSAQWHLPHGHDYRLSHLHGRWANEWNICREPLTPGIKVLESRRLTTSHHHNPWFARRCVAVGATRTAARSGSARWPGAATGSWRPR